MRLHAFCTSIAIAFIAFVAGLPGIAAGSTVSDLSGDVNFTVSSTEFVFQTGAPRGNVPVLYTSSVVVPNGSGIRNGQRVAVTGYFDIYGKLHASRVAIGSHYHIATLAYDNYGGQGYNASAATVNQLVTYAQGNAKSLNDCHSRANGCKAVFYLNPNHIWNDTPLSCIYHPDADEMAASSEGWFVHDRGYSDKAHRVYGIDGAGCRMFELNPNSLGLQTWWRSYLRTNADQYDVYFLDADQMGTVDEGYFPYGSGGGCLPWPSYCHSTQEIPDDKAEVVAHANFVDAMSHRDGSPMFFIFQQATFKIPLDVSAFQATHRFIAISCEGCIATYASPVRPSLYASVLSEMAAVNESYGAYLLLSHGSFPTGSALQILQRLVTTGIVWLGYSEGHTIVQPDLEANTNRLAVWPEDLIYPSAPRQSMETGAGNLEVAPGVYRREFAACYQRGVAIGPCAAIVNSNGYGITIRSAWLSQSYRHVVTLAGGDVLSGGIANISGASFVPNFTAVTGTGALLLAK
jgi:hypothetical protein